MGSDQLRFIRALRGAIGVLLFSLLAAFIGGWLLAFLFLSLVLVAFLYRLSSGRSLS